jgi:hypothetical protein
MKREEGPGVVDIMVVILSPVIVAGLTVIFMLGWWAEAVWRWVKGDRG